MPLKIISISKIILLASSLFSAVAAAESLWVTDQLFIMMRSGEGNGFRIKRRLPSGAEVTVLSKNAATGYAHVQYRGNDGYVLTRQLMNEPAARTRLEAAKAEAGSALNQFERLNGELTKVKAELIETKQLLTKVTTSRDKHKADLSALQASTANVQGIMEENEGLQEAVNAYENEKEEIFSENKTLKDQSSQRWVAIGGGLVFLGVLIGLILPMMYKNKSSSYH